MAMALFMKKMQSLKSKTLIKEYSSHGSDDRNNSIVPENSVCTLQKTYLNISRWFGLAPFKIEFDGLKTEYVIQKPGKIGQLTILLIEFLSIVRIFWTTIHVVEDPEHLVADKIFRVTWYIWIFYLLTVYRILWRKQDQICLVLNGTEHLSNKLHRRGIRKILSKTTAKLIAISLVFYYFCAALIDTLSVNSVFLEEEFSVAFQLTSDAYKKAFSCLYQIFAAVSVDESVLTVLMLFLHFFANLVTHFANLLGWTAAVVLFLFMIRVTSYLKDLDPNKLGGNFESVKNVLTLFSDLLDFSDTVEGGLGGLVFGQIFALLPYYSFEFKNVLIDNKGFETLCFFLYVTPLVSLLWMAAEANAMMSDFGKWLRLMTNDENLPLESDEMSVLPQQKRGHSVREYLSDRLSILMSPINGNEFGLKTRNFTITYGLLGNLTGLLITYTVIIIQFKGENVSYRAQKMVK